MSRSDRGRPPPSAGGTPQGVMEGEKWKNLSPSLYGYLFAVLLTIVFAVLVNALMYFRLKKIDMIESLKSVE
ncbi:MAG: hypothetical protein MR290_06210 [Ruminococcus sp.]|nr:hypothetical protein [Ruminococcus sp.]